MYKLVLNDTDTYFEWNINTMCTINSITFIPILSLKCISAPNQYNDHLDFIRKDEVYPAILITEDTSKSLKQYLIINRQGHKQYFHSHLFDIIAPDCIL